MAGDSSKQRQRTGASGEPEGGSSTKQGHGPSGGAMEEVAGGVEVQLGWEEALEGESQLGADAMG